MAATAAGSTSTPTAVARPQPHGREGEHAAAAPHVEHPLAAADEIDEGGQRQPRRDVGAAAERPAGVDDDLDQVVISRLVHPGRADEQGTHPHRPGVRPPGVERRVEVERDHLRGPAAGHGREQRVGVASLGRARDEDDVAAGRHRRPFLDRGRARAPQRVGGQLGLAGGHGHPHRLRRRPAARRVTRSEPG